MFTSILRTRSRVGILSWLTPSLTTLLITATQASAIEPLRYEAEDVSQVADGWLVNRSSESQWNLWSTDKDADRKWSGGVVLQSPRVLADRPSAEAGAPPLHTVIRDIPANKYDVTIGGVGRPIGVSLDGKTWRKIDGSSRNLGRFDIQEGRFELWVDDRYASATNPGSCYYDYLELRPLPDPNRKPKIHGFAETRVTEALDRGLVVLQRPDTSVYLSWRLLAGDPADSAFDVYRRTGTSETRKLNAQPIVATTDFVDISPKADVSSEYYVVARSKMREDQRSRAVAIHPSQEPGNYISIPLRGDDTFQKCGIADLDGDGRYDYVVKLPNANIDPYEKYWQPSPETYKIEAYLADGTFLWRYDMGWAVERGIWYSPLLVYDLDGDGRAEVCLKAGEGDPRDGEGRVQQGAEYLLILDGLTGQPRTRIEWPHRDAFPSYNYASRNQMGIAYLDGKTPCLIIVRGTYNVIQVRAYQFHEERLHELWRWEDQEEGELYRGQGAHSMHAADVDHDGRDEVFLGSAVLDDNGVGLWSTGLGHPDHHYVGDIDPKRPGLEVYYGIETRRANAGCCLADAATGEILWRLDEATRHVHSTGMCADLDAAVDGLECYSSDTDAEKKSERRWLFDARGNMLRRELDWGFGLRTVLWDGDLQYEIVRGGRILDYPAGEHTVTLSGSIVGVADVMGDWREELIVTVPGELRVYTTTIPAQDRRICLMQDPLYRSDVCIQAMGYTQCPRTSTYLSGKGK